MCMGTHYRRAPLSAAGHPQGVVFSGVIGLSTALFGYLRDEGATLGGKTATLKE